MWNTQCIDKATQLNKTSPKSFCPRTVPLFNHKNRFKLPYKTRKLNPCCHHPDILPCTSRTTEQTYINPMRHRKPSVQTHLPPVRPKTFSSPTSATRCPFNVVCGVGDFNGRTDAEPENQKGDLETESRGDRGGEWRISGRERVRVMWNTTRGGAIYSEERMKLLRNDYARWWKKKRGTG